MLSAFRHIFVWRKAAAVAFWVSVTGSMAAAAFFMGGCRKGERMKPPVSVIMPVYNAAAYLPAALESVCVDLKQGAELVAANNCSVDESLQILKNFAARHSAVTVLDVCAGMAGGARNAALCKASGEYVFFMDADDCLYPGALAELYQTAKRENADIVLGQKVIFTEGEPVWTQQKSSVVNARWEREKLGACGLFILSQNYNVPWGKLIRKSLLDSYALRFPEGMPHEDLAFMSTVFALAGKVVSCNTCCYAYRETQGSLSRRNPADKVAALFHTFARMRGDLVRTGIYEELAEEYEFYLLQMLIGGEGAGNGNLKRLPAADMRRFFHLAAEFYAGVPGKFFACRSWLFRWKYACFLFAIKYKSVAAVRICRILTDVLGCFCQRR